MRAESPTPSHLKERHVRILDVDIDDPNAENEGDYGRNFAARGQVSEVVGEGDTGGNNYYRGDYSGRMGVRETPSEEETELAVMYLFVSYQLGGRSFRHSFERQTSNSAGFRQVVGDSEAFKMEVADSLERGLRFDG